MTSGIFVRLYIFNQNPKIIDSIIEKYLNTSSNIFVIKSILGIVPLSYARNKVIEQLTDGGVVVFCDDDATYHVNFATDLAREIMSVDNFKLGYFRLLNKGLLSTFGNRHYPRISRCVWSLTAINSCISLNMVVDTDMLKSSGGFDERLGVGAGIACGEETDLLIRLLEINTTCHYFQSPIAFHPAYKMIDSSVKKTYAYSSGYRNMLFLKQRSRIMTFTLTIHYLLLLNRSFIGLVIRPREFKSRLFRLRGLLGL
jgi:hypothetical protein